MENIQDLEEQIIDHCRFCNPPERERILFETENFYIMLSLGPIVEGYSLIVSKQHFQCCANIPPEYRTEFKELYYQVKTVLRKIYGDCICFEHGRAGSCMIPLEGSKHCYHAHMHFVPVAVNLNVFVQKDYDELKLTDLSEFFDLYTKMKSPPYLFVDDEEGLRFYCVDIGIRRQYLRFKVAKALGKSELWDWVQYQGWEKIQSALETLTGEFKKIKE